MNRAQAAAQDLLRRFGEHEPERLAERLDILVLSCDLPETVEGFYQQIAGRQIIYLNNRLPPCRRRVVCGHELGHAMLHSTCNSLLMGGADERLEQEADLFCAELLLADGTDGANDIRSIVRQTGLPEHAVRRKFALL